MTKGFAVEEHGSLILLRPLTQRAQEWIRKHTQEDALWFGGGLVVEPRYATEIVSALADSDGDNHDETEY